MTENEEGPWQTYFSTDITDKFVELVPLDDKSVDSTKSSSDKTKKKTKTKEKKTSKKKITDKKHVSDKNDRSEKTAKCWGCCANTTDQYTKVTQETPNCNHVQQQDLSPEISVNKLHNLQYLPMSPKLPSMRHYTQAVDSGAASPFLPPHVALKIYEHPMKYSSPAKQQMMKTQWENQATEATAELKKQSSEESSYFSSTEWESSTWSQSKHSLYKNQDHRTNGEMKSFKPTSVSSPSTPLSGDGKVKSTESDESGKGPSDSSNEDKTPMNDIPNAVVPLPYLQELTQENVQFMNKAQDIRPGMLNSSGNESSYTICKQYTADTDTTSGIANTFQSSQEMSVVDEIANMNLSHSNSKDDSVLIESPEVPTKLSTQLFQSKSDVNESSQSEISLCGKSNNNLNSSHEFGVLTESDFNGGGQSDATFGTLSSYGGKESSLLTDERLLTLHPCLKLCDNESESHQNGYEIKADDAANYMSNLRKSHELIIAKVNKQIRNLVTDEDVKSDAGTEVTDDSEIKVTLVHDLEKDTTLWSGDDTVPSSIADSCQYMDSHDNSSNADVESLDTDDLHGSHEGLLSDLPAPMPLLDYSHLELTKVNTDLPPSPVPILSRNNHNGQQQHSPSKQSGGEKFVFPPSTQHFDHGLQKIYGVDKDKQLHTNGIPNYETAHEIISQQLLLNPPLGANFQKGENTIINDSKERVSEEKHNQVLKSTNPDNTLLSDQKSLSPKEHVFYQSNSFDSSSNVSEASDGPQTVVCAVIHSSDQPDNPATKGSNVPPNKQHGNPVLWNENNEVIHAENTGSSCTSPSRSNDAASPEPEMTVNEDNDLEENKNKLKDRSDRAQKPNKCFEKSIESDKAFRTKHSPERKSKRRHEKRGNKQTTKDKNCVLFNFDDKIVEEKVPEERSKRSSPQRRSPRKFRDAESSPSKSRRTSSKHSKMSPVHSVKTRSIPAVITREEKIRGNPPKVRDEALQKRIILELPSSPYSLKKDSDTTHSGSYGGSYGYTDLSSGSNNQTHYVALPPVNMGKYTVKFGEKSPHSIQMPGHFSHPKAVDIFPNNDIVVLDSENCTIQVISERGVCKKVYQFKSGIVDMIVWDSKTLALLKSNEISMFSLPRYQIDNMRLKNVHFPIALRKMTLPKQQTMFVIAMVTHVVIYTQQGDFLHTIPSHVDQGYGNLYIKRIGRITVNPNTCDVIIIDIDLKTIYIFTWEGDHKFTIDTKFFPMGGIANPQGLCLDNGGNLLIADSFNHRVLQILHGPAAGGVRVLLQYHMEFFPCALAITRDNRLVVAMDSEGRSFAGIRVYNYKYAVR